MNSAAQPFVRTGLGMTQPQTVGHYPNRTASVGPVGTQPAYVSVIHFDHYTSAAQLSALPWPGFRQLDILFSETEARAPVALLSALAISVVMVIVFGAVLQPWNLQSSIS
jgi:hypothetical protein